MKFVVTTVHSSRLLGADFYAQSTCYCPEKQTFVGRFLSKVNLLLPGQADFWGPIFMHSQLATARTSRLLRTNFYAVNLLLPGQADFWELIFTHSQLATAWTRPVHRYLRNKRVAAYRNFRVLKSFIYCAPVCTWQRGQM